MLRAALLILVVLVPAAAQAQRGVPQGGFPSWQERMMLVLANRARADPAQEQRACDISTPRAPMQWSYHLNRAARFHSSNMARTGQFQHNSPCTLVSNISNLYPPYGTCDGSASCACVGGSVACSPTCTSWSERITMFGGPGGGRGENIAGGQPTPRAVHTAWMNSAGHCNNLLGGSYVSFGGGWDSNRWTQNFSSSGSLGGTLIAGGHEPQRVGSSATNIEFRLNYYDTRGAPSSAELNVDGDCSPMTLERGGATNATYLAAISMSGTGCRRYSFVFTDPGGARVVLPESGAYMVGGTSCADWDASAPASCDVSIPPPTVASSANASPNPVTGTETSVSVLGASQAGEESLTYTWSAAGPAPVSFSPNASGSARNSTAAFSETGTYTLTATIRDEANQSATSSVDVTVEATVTAVSVSPSSATVAVDETQQFTATATDQFTETLSPSPGFAWSVSGGGSIDQAGLFSAGPGAGGPHTVEARAHDVTGSAAVTVVEDDVVIPPLQVTLVEPAAGQVVSETVRMVAVATSEIGVSHVDFLVEGEEVGTASGEPHELDWDSEGRPAGGIELWARAVDLEGNEAESARVAVYLATGEDPIPPPWVRIVSPEDGERIADATLWIHAEAGGEVGITEVAFEVDGEVVKTLLEEPWSVGLEMTSREPGELELVAIARDAAGSVTRSEAVRVERVEQGQPLSMEGACGCASDGGAALPWAALLLLLLPPLIAGRRRAAPSPPS